MERGTLFYAVALVITGFPLCAMADAESNLRKMVDAARSLTWSLPDNRAQLLVKLETIESPVAVIFGYADNAAACHQIATVLSKTVSRAGTFQYHPTY